MQVVGSTAELGQASDLQGMQLRPGQGTMCSTATVKLRLYDTVKGLHLH